MPIGGVNVGQELLNVPMGDMIRSMALAIAQAQWELDKSSMTVTELMSGQRLLRDLDSGKLLDKHGVPLEKSTETQKTPTIIDSRVYFGYTVLQLDLSATNQIDGQDPTAEQKASIEAAFGKTLDKLDDANKATLKKGLRVPQRLSMIELGFVPTFYQFVETVIEVKIDIHITTSTDTTQSSAQSTTVLSNNGYWWQYNRQYGVSTSQVNAAYSNKFSCDLTGSSFLRTKLVPVPPPAILEERIRLLMETERAYLVAHPEKQKEAFR